MTQTRVSYPKQRKLYLEALESRKGGAGGEKGKTQERYLLHKNGKAQGHLVQRRENRITILKHGKVAPELWTVSSYFKLHHDFSQDFRKIFLIRRKEKHWKRLPKDKDELLQGKLHQVKGLKGMLYKYLLEMTTAQLILPGGSRPD